MPFQKGNKLGTHRNHVNNCNPLALIGIKWMHKDGQAIRVKPDQVDQYRADGWKVGRLPFSKETLRKLSEAQKRRDPATRVYSGNFLGYWSGKQMPEAARQKMRKPKGVLAKLGKYGITQEAYVEARQMGLKWCIFHKAFEPKENFNNPESGNPCRRQRTPGISKTPDERRKFILWARYRMKPSEYLELFDKQKGKCALCSSDPNGRRLAVDHNHACCNKRTSCGKCWRGLLCHECNQRLGRLERFMKSCTITAKEGTWEHRALAYLQSYEKEPEFAVIETGIFCSDKRDAG